MPRFSLLIAIFPQLVISHIYHAIHRIHMMPTEPTKSTESRISEPTHLQHFLAKHLMLVKIFLLKLVSPMRVHRTKATGTRCLWAWERERES